MMAMAARKLEGLPPDAPPAESDLVPFNIRLPRGLIAALDARVAKINGQRKWTKINRSDLIRDLLARGIDQPSDEEGEHAREAALSDDLKAKARLVDPPKPFRTTRGK